jgi:methyl-accepting chemotaxis protein
MTAATSPAPEKTGRHQRSAKNYLIDKRFQLKYTGFIVGMALVISIILGAFLVSTSSSVVEESKKVSQVATKNITDDPAYADNPELLKSFKDAADEQDRVTMARQRNMLISIMGGLTLLVLFIGVLGIYFTHKVAGPIYKMKLLLRQVGQGKLNFRGGLRKGDELQDFFEAFAEMTASLKERQAKEIELLESGIEAAKTAGASAESLEKIVTVRDEMKRALEV